jgi:hypothetical protein
MIFFVTGASGAGKSACLPGLSELFPDMAVHDFRRAGRARRRRQEMRFQRWAEWQRGDAHWRAHVLDTTPLTALKVSVEVADWVRARLTEQV